ncbi:sigma-70 family RNA polymerase sigma factor, partial [Gordonia aichiensis]
MNEATDRLALLLSRVATGDAGAFAQFYDETSDRVYGMVLRIVRDRGISEETTQEVFLTVWRSAHTFDAESGSPLGWLMTLAHRRAVDRVRSETAAKRRLHVYSTAEQSTRIEHDVVSESAERRETVREVRSLLCRLT